MNNAEHAREDMKFKYKAIYIGMVVVLPIMAVVTAYAPLFVGPLVVDLWGFAIPVIIVLRITSGRKTKKSIRDARNNLNAEYNRPEYVGGQEGFPSKFYSYTAISKLMNLIQENRAASFQEAYNLLEIQGIQEEQLRMARHSAEYQRQQAEYSKLAIISQSDIYCRMMFVLLMLKHDFEIFSDICLLYVLSFSRNVKQLAIGSEVYVR